MAHLFWHLGYDVGAQHDKDDGQSHNFPKLWPPEALRTEYKYLIQVVRDPILVAESVFLAKYSLPAQNNSRAPAIGLSDSGTGWGADGPCLRKTIRSIVFWNDAISEASPDLVVKVEEADTVCQKWLHEMGMTREVRDKAPKPGINHRHKSGWNLDDKVPWGALDEEHFSMLKKHSTQYGYPEERIDALRNETKATPETQAEAT